GTTGDPAGYVPALIGVGYGGIRIASRDGGKTWGDRSYETTSGGDDDVLLRAVVYGKGLWVATGWKLWTSTDGVKWTDHGKLKDGPVKSCAIIEGLAYKDPNFYGVCDGNVFRSSDASPGPRSRISATPAPTSISSTGAASSSRTATPR